MIKLIVTDMDGTLLDDQGKFPEGFSAFLQEMKQRGAQVYSALLFQCSERIPFCINYIN